MGTIKKTKRPTREYVPARVRVVLTPGDSVRIARELQEMTQADLAKASGVTQPTISSIESGSVTLGAERAEKLARALRVHPAVLLWPRDVGTEAKRAGASASRRRGETKVKGWSRRGSKRKRRPCQRAPIVA
jgi:transcriptional regulator with XRE-family HTH domain